MSKGFSEIKRVQSKDDLIGGEFKKISETELNFKKHLFNLNLGTRPSCNEAWVSSKFVVMVFYRYIELQGWKGDIKHLTVKPISDKPIKNHWMTLQEIKNKIVGEEHNAIEIYPKKSLVVDQANLYHLWAFPKGFEFSFGLHIPGWF